LNNSAPRLAVVIPAYNEKTEILVEVLYALRNYSFDVIIVDDGSSSPLKLKASNLISIIRHIKKKRQGAALNTGTMKAYQLGYDYCAHFDADGQHSADNLLSMLNEMQNSNADILIGSRFLRKETRQEIPWSKKIVLKGGTVLNYLLSGIWLTDSNCGIRVLNRKAMEKLVFRAERMAHASELIWLIKKHGLKYKEFPVYIKYTAYSKMKGQNLYRLFPVTWEVIKAYLRFKFDKNTTI